MKIRTTLWVIPLLGMLAAPAIAARAYDEHHRDSRIEQRLDRQHQRIKQGVRSGELTHREADRLRRQHRQILRLERRLSRDGHLGRHDRRTLHRELDAASGRIYRLKHNDRFRNAHAGRHAPGHHKPGYRYDDNTRWSVRLNVWDHL